MLALVTTTTGFAKPGADPTTNTLASRLAAWSRFQIVQMHQDSSTRTMYETLFTMPRVSGVSMTSTV